MRYRGGVPTESAPSEKPSTSPQVAVVSTRTAQAASSSSAARAAAAKLI
jgi:hypothetical protein